MKRKKRRTAPPRRAGPPVKKPAADGYSNPAGFLGEASPLLSSGTFVRSGVSSDPELLTAMYRESWLAKRIIDMPSEDMTRAWYRLSSSVNPEEIHALRRLEMGLLGFPDIHD